MIFKPFLKLSKIILKNNRLLVFLLIFLLGTTVGMVYSGRFSPAIKNQLIQQDPYEAFLSEVYDKIKDNYWDKISDESLINLFKLASQKLGNMSLDVTSNNKNDFIKEYLKALKNVDQDKRRETTVKVVAAVLANLNPAGRSGLYTTQLETQLKNTVNNVNPEKDLYKDLGLNKGASQQEVEAAQKKLTTELQKQAESSPEAKKKLEAVDYASQVLSKDDSKQKYDAGGVEPTVFSKMISPDISYVYLKKFSPTTYDEFQQAFADLDKENGPKSLIFDLRGNVGGAIDVLPYFLGNFLGKNQYAFDFFHQGDYKPFKTTLDKLSGINRFKQVVILVDNKTQSSAEVMAATLKKYHFGVVVGQTTKGWGTVERVFPIEHQIDSSEKYSIFLVHSITLRDDGAPIEGRGVEPNINISSSDWRDQLNTYFHNPELTQAVKTIIEQKGE